METPDYNSLYLKEKERVTWNRRRLFSSIGNSDTIEGIEVNALTARAYLDLQLIDCDILTGGWSHQGIKQYIFRNHVRYPFGKIRKFFIESKIDKLLSNDETENELIKSIFRHIGDAFSEAAEQASDGSFHRSSKLGAVDGMTGAIDEVSARYGQAPEDVAEYPLAKIFSLQKAARVATIPNYKVLEPKTLRDIKSQHLKNLKNGK